MEEGRSRLVLIVSDDEGTSHALGRCAIKNSASVYVVHERVPEAVSALSSWLAAVVLDIRTDQLADSAWRVIELLRQNEETVRTPVVVRYDVRHAISSELLLALNPIRSVEAERGVGAVCEALAEALGNRAAWPTGIDRHLAAG